MSIEQAEAQAKLDHIFSNGSAEAQQEKKSTKMKQKTDDLLVQIVQEISGLDSKSAIEAVPSLFDGADENYFRLGGVLSLIQAQKFYAEAGFANFKDFIEKQYAFKYREALYWIGIYEALVESGVSWNKVKDIGWTKLKDLAPILTLENVDEWVQKALSMTTLALKEAIKASKAGTLADSGTEVGASTPTTTFTVKVHAEQKATIREAIDKAKTESGTEYDGTALENICINYLAGGNVSKPKSLVEFLKAHTPEDALLAFEQIYPEFEVTAKLKKSVKN
ncbi:unnamed protein product [Sphagnum balticum]